MPETTEPVTVDRRAGPYGEVVLRERGRHYEIIANGCFLMDTSDGRSERRLVDAAPDALPAGRPTPAPLIGGPGVGFSPARAAAQSRWGRIAVIEREQAVIDRHHKGPLSRISGPAPADSRCDIIHTDLVVYVGNGRNAHPDSCPDPNHDTYDALCLDIDNGPDRTVTDTDGHLYSPRGLVGCMGLLRPGGNLAVRSARAVRRLRGLDAECRIQLG